ncbi:MAG TPA: hypothetical protein VGW75_04625 [Solirubrobacteraceae bacterium]|nr:hypothetical protein [Solirubrobacteraceae bacterium]
MAIPVFHPARRSLAAAAALAVAFALTPAAAAPAQAASWTCEGSAVRGTVLGAATIEPLTANKGQETCKPARAGLTGLTASLPLPIGLSALGAETTVENADQPADRQRVTAFGGITDLRVRALPELPLRIPVPDLSAVPAVSTPLGTIDLKPAVAALLPDGRLPNADIVSIQALTARAAGRCADGRAELTGESRVAGLSVLGQELPVNQVVERTVSLVDSQSIDPSDANLDNLQLAPGVVLTNPIKAQLQQVLDALPDIVIPATLATVKITPGQQIRSGDRLTQRALQVQVSLLGQQLVDLVIGEASVGTSGGVVCGQTAAESALACTTRRLVLVDVIPGRRRVRLLGYADNRYVGRRVGIYFMANGRRVARPLVRRDGSFRATAPMPARRLRATNRARYQARIGRERSLRLKLMRRMQVLGVRTSGRRVTIAGRVVPPLGRPIRAIEVRRRVSCSRWQVVKRIRPTRTGHFRTTIAGPPRSLSATYRFATRVRSSARGKSRKTFETFTLPRFVDLG